MSKVKRIGQVIPEAVSRFEGKSHQTAGSRDVTRGEKLLFVDVCRKICPEFQITEQNKPLLNDIVRWCLMLEGKYDPCKGLWIWGDIGSGKSTMLKIIREYAGIVRPPCRYREKYDSHFMRDELMRYSFRITKASVVAGEFARKSYPGLDDYIQNCRQAFDEVGRESIPTCFYGNAENVFQYILQARYDLRNGDFTHVTTNLSPEQIKAVYGDFIYDRCIEMFNFVEMSGYSWR